MSSLRSGGSPQPHPDHTTHLLCLEYLLLPVDDLEHPLGQPLANVPRVQPALLIQGLPSLLVILEVAFEHTGPLEADLTQKCKHQSVLPSINVYLPPPQNTHLPLIVGAEVVHLGDVHQFDHDAGEGWAHVTG